MCVVLLPKMIFFSVMFSTYYFVANRHCYRSLYEARTSLHAKLRGSTPEDPKTSSALPHKEYIQGYTSPIAQALRPNPHKNEQLDLSTTTKHISLSPIVKYKVVDCIVNYSFSIDI